MAGQRVKVGVFGASGYVGQDAVEILTRHPGAEVVFATANSYAGQPVPGTGLNYIRAEDAPLDAVEAVFLALPHGASAQVAAEARSAGVRVIDLSADLRLDTPERYRQWYDHEHPHPELLPTPYGLPEINRDRIAGQAVVAAPGCYPTTTLLGLFPLLKHRWIAPETPIIVDAKSGVSGAGRDPKPHLHFVEVYGLSLIHISEPTRH